MTQTRPLIPHNLSLLEIAAIVAVIVIWGVNNAAAKVATDSLPPLMTGSMRFALTALCLTLLIRRSRTGRACW